MCLNPPIKKKLDILELNRQSRRDMLSELELKHSLFIDALDSFKGRGKEDVPKEVIRKFPYMEWVSLSDKVKFRKRGTIYNDVIMFDTEMDKGGKFGMHIHSDCTETFEVIKGEVLDLQTNKTYKAGDVVFYDKNEKHIPVAIQDTILRVFFK